MPDPDTLHGIGLILLGVGLIAMGVSLLIRPDSEFYILAAIIPALITPLLILLSRQNS